MPDSVARVQSKMLGSGTCSKWKTVVGSKELGRCRGQGFGVLQVVPCITFMDARRFWKYWG